MRTRPNLIPLWRKAHTVFSFIVVLFSLGPLSEVAAENQEARPIKIGFILPMTGPAADFGVAMKNAIELAIEDDEVARTRVKPIIEDAQYEVKNAVNAFASLRTISKVDIVVVWGLGQCRAVAPVAEKQKIPLIAICLAPEVAAARPHVLRFQSSSDDYMKATNDWLMAVGAKRIGVLLSENGYTEEMFAALERQRNTNQTITIIDRIPAAGQDFYTQVLKVRESRYDAFGLFLAVAQAGTFARQMKIAGGQPIVFGTNVIRSESEVVSAEGGLEGALVSDIRIHRSFLDRYVERFKSEAQLGFAAMAYETVRLISANLAAPLEDKEFGQVVFNRILSTGVRRDTIVGNYTITTSQKEGSYAKFDLGMMRVKGRGFEYVPAQ
jgi:branched-chain amino acid transport system substrate-binding protein